MGTQNAHSIKPQGGKSMMDRMVWLLCPVCGNKTRLKVRQDTELIHVLQYCQKRKQEVFINIKTLPTCYSYECSICYAIRMVYLSISILEKNKEVVTAWEISRTGFGRVRQANW